MTRLRDPVTMRREQVPTERVRRVRPEQAARAAVSAPAGPLVADPEVSFTQSFSWSMLNPWAVAGGASVTPLVVIAAVSFLAGADTNAIFVLAPVMRSSLGYDIAFTFAFTQLVNNVTALLAPWMGYLADRFNRVWIVRIGVFITHLAAFGIGFGTTPFSLVALRSLTGVGMAVNQAGSGTLVSDYYRPSVRGRVFGFILMMGSAGGVFAPVAAGLIAAQFGWRLAFICLGGFSTLVCFAYFALREPVRGEQDRLELGVDPLAAKIADQPVSFSESLRATRSVGTFRRLWYATPFLSVANFASLVLINYYYDTWHQGLVALGAIFAGKSLASFVAQLLAGPITDRYIHDRPGRIFHVVALAGVVAALGLLAAALAPVLWLSVLGTMVMSAGAFLMIPQYSPLLTALTSVAVPARIRGFGMQTVQFWTVPGTILVLFVLGEVQHITLDPHLLLLPYIPFFLIAGVILATGAVTVERDIRAALAANVAEEAARQALREGRSKLLVCRDLDVVYDGARVLFGVDFDVTEGEIVAVLGTNGSGKSTLLRAIAGIQEPSSGAILLDGVDVTHAQAHRNAGRGVVMVPGGRAIFPTLTVAENLGAAEQLAAQQGADVGARREAVLTLFPVLRERMRQQAGNLSGGEQQMLALAQAFMLQPRLLMVDELTLGLAPQVVEVLLDALRRIHASGTTIILVEQSVNLALTIADRAVFMEKGKVTFEGPTRELLHRGDIVHSTFLGRTGGASLTPARERRAPVEEAGVILRVDSVRLSYGGVRALDGISLDVRQGEIVGFIGPNGAGKSTLFDVISGFTRPDSGTVQFLDADVTREAPDARARMGLVRSFQNVRLFSALTVRENIAVAYERHLKTRSALLAATYFPVRADERRIARRTEVLIDSLGLRPYADKFVNELSTGSRRIVDLACLLIAEPRALLLDEPSSGLAQAETEELGPLIQRIARETGCSILVVEHDVPLVSSLAQRLVAMREGRVIADGEPAQVVAQPEVIEAYLGTTEEILARSGRAPSPVPA